MRKQTPQPSHRNVIHLRIDESLRERLQQAADTHRCSLVREIRNRLLDSLDDITGRGFEDIRRDMEICWARFSARFLRMELGDQLADAVVKGEEPGRVKTLARLIIEHRTTEQRPSSLGSMS
jgi:hypothetical protein